MKLYKRGLVRIAMTALAVCAVGIIKNESVVAAETQFVQEMQEEGAVTWSFNNETGILTISGTGQMENYSSGSATPWYSQIENIKSVVIESGVTSIGNCAFYNCSNMTGIEIPSGVTSIGEKAFYNCSSLNAIEIPVGMTSIGVQAFRNCSNMNSIEIPEGVTSIEEKVFSNCTNLSTVTIPAGVTSIEEQAFYNCSSLSSIEIPEGVTSIEAQVFSNCTNLSTVTIPAGVTSIGEKAFSGCVNLITITLPDEVTIIGAEAFHNCSSLISMTLPNEVMAIGDCAFQKCSSLNNIDIPDSVTSIGAGVFWDCINMKSVEIPDGVTIIGDKTFAGCSSLSSIKMPKSLLSIGADAFYSCENLSSMQIPVEVTYLGESAFEGCSRLTSIEMPVGLTSIENKTFCNCSNLKSIKIPAGVVRIGIEAFRGCSNLSDIEIPAGVTSIENEAFRGCSGLSSIRIPLEVTSMGLDVFRGCSKLKSAELSCEWKDDSLYNFGAGVSVQYKHIGDNVYTADDEVNTITQTCDACESIVGTVTLNAPTNRTYTGSVIEAEVENTISNMTPVVTYSGNNLVNEKPVYAGAYTATMTLNAATQNLTVSLDYEIEKALFEADTINKMYVYSAESADSIDLKQLLPANCTTVVYGMPQTAGDVTYSVSPLVDNGVLSYTVNIGNANTMGTITVPVSTDNYEDFDITIHVMLTDQRMIDLREGTEIILQNDTLTYGETLSVLEFQSAEFVDEEGNVVTGTIEWKNPQMVPNAGTTSAAWIFTPDDITCVSLEGIVSITVNKAVPAITEVPVVESRIYHPTRALMDSELLGGTADMEGTWSWQTAGIVPVVDNNGYEAVFTPNDAANYETVIKTIDVKVTKATPYIQTPPDASAITYGATLADSVLADGAVQYSVKDKTAVTGSFAWMTGNNRPTVAESETPIYAVVFTPADTSNYNIVETMVGLKVNKALNAPNMPADTVSVSFNVQKVNEVSLPKDWKWQETDKGKGFSQGATITAVAEYIGADKGNYENVKVTVTITRTGKEWIFTDVAIIPGHWKYEGVKYVYENDIMNGISGTTEFRPDIGLNRAMFATVLYRMAGNPKVQFEEVFTDVKAGKYYSEAVLWAKQKGIVSGFSDGSYGVEVNITREQIAKMLCEYATKQGYDVSGKASLEAFTDKESVNGWAIGYMQWAVDAGMISGKPNGDNTFRLDPKGNATRAECAKMLKYFMEKYN